MRIGFPSVLNGRSRLERSAVAVVALSLMTACESLHLPGSETAGFIHDLPQLEATRLKNVTVEGMIDRRAELKMLPIKTRMASVGGGDDESAGSVSEGERALVMVHREVDGTLARVRLVQGNDKLLSTDTAYYDEGELFRYSSELSHTVEKEGYFKLTAISDVYEIADGAISSAYSMTRSKIRDRGSLLKNETVRGALDGEGMGLGQIESAVDRRLAFVEKRISPEEFLAGETR